MCGIIGIINWQHLNIDPRQTGTEMLGLIRHRGPDGQGLYVDDTMMLGHARLSIIDPEGGWQPLANEDESIWLVCNGEIFNYIELRTELVRMGHSFRTKTDVEVLIHLYEEYQQHLFDHINGQFAFIIWDKKRNTLLLARDHIGICPLYYWGTGDTWAFASEMKALLPLKQVKWDVNFQALMQSFVFWAPLPGNSPFEGIREIKPAHYMHISGRSVEEVRYWSPNFHVNCDRRITDVKEAQERLFTLLTDAVKIRLRSDVPVGAYLSGGLDSSIITSAIRLDNSNPLRTFSIGFSDRSFDETPYQQQMSRSLHTDHSSIQCTDDDILQHLEQVIWHAEKPLLRTSPVPLFILSNLVNRHHYKVVLTGEGADEYFSGYNIYRETKVRLFNARQPDSKWRPLLFQRLYPYLGNQAERSNRFWMAFFRQGLKEVDDPFYSHRLRWHNGQFLPGFLNDDILQQYREYDPIIDLSSQLNGELDALSPLERAHFIETYIFLSSYLICSQGDRMLMGHAVEGRYPFLDRRVIEFANQLAPWMKIRGLNEKWILKKTFAHRLPADVIARPKQPYRAPIRSLIRKWFEYRYDTSVGSEFFDRQRVGMLFRKMRLNPLSISAREEMAWIGIVSTNMLWNSFRKPPKYATRVDFRLRLIDRRKEI